MQTLNPRSQPPRVSPHRFESPCLKKTVPPDTPETPILCQQSLTGLRTISSSSLIKKPERLFHRSGSPCQQHFVLSTTSSDSLMKKQVPSPFIVVVVELRGFEPLTFSLRTRRATNCAIAPRYSQKPKRVTGKFANYEAVGLRSRKITRLRPRQPGRFITI